MRVTHSTVCGLILALIASTEAKPVIPIPQRTPGYPSNSGFQSADFVSHHGKDDTKHVEPKQQIKFKEVADFVCSPSGTDSRMIPCPTPPLREFVFPKPTPLDLLEAPNQGTRFTETESRPVIKKAKKSGHARVPPRPVIESVSESSDERPVRGITLEPKKSSHMDQPEDFREEAGYLATLRVLPDMNWPFPIQW